MGYHSPYPDPNGYVGSAVRIPSTGTYRVSGNIPIYVDSTSTGAGSIQTAVFVNGAIRAIMSAGYVSAVGTRLYTSGSAILNLNAGDYAEIGVVNSSTAALIYTVYPDAPGPICYLKVDRIAV